MQDETSPDNSIVSDFPQRFRYWLAHSGLRAVDLAESLDMSESAVSRWGSGSALPSLGTSERIAATLGITLQQFWGEMPGVESK